MPSGSRTSSSNSCRISEIWCPSDRAVLKNTCDGGCGTISPPIAPPPTCPPLGLLPEPHRARDTRVSNAHHEEMEGGIWHLPRAVLVPPDQDLAADARRRRSILMLPDEVQWSSLPNEGGSDLGKGFSPLKDVFFYCGQKSL